MHKLALGVALVALTAVSCVRNQPEVIVITATFEASQPNVNQPPIVLTVAPTLAPGQLPTPDPTVAPQESSDSGEYIVQPGDTLSGIAAATGVSVATLLSINNLANPDVLEVGQVIRLPGAPPQITPDFKILPDARVVLGPGSGGFDVAAFVASQPGFIHEAIDMVGTDFLTGARVITRVSREYSVDPRLLLALLEMKSGWLSNPTPSDDLKVFPMGANDLSIDRSGLYKQLAWASDRINQGYYGWKGRGLTALEFADGTRMAFNTGLNAGTIGIQHMLSMFNTYDLWTQQVSPNGLARVYAAYFGDPFAGVVDPLLPPDLAQPELTLPFPSDETWFYTGGPHGGWGPGSAWSAIDFAPPDDVPEGGGSCYISTQFATAVASGMIARTDTGTVILDLDGDGDETTGWTILYLHMAEVDRIAAGTQVNMGDKIGHPSCEGGFSNATHMHIARRYNGEWIPASCDACLPGRETPPFVMAGWTTVGLLGQEYQGYLMNGNETRVAEQGRLTLDNRVPG